MTIRTIARIFTFAKPYRLQLTISVIALFTVIGVNLYAPLLARELIDRSEWSQGSAVIAATLIGAYFLRGVMRAASISLSHYASMFTYAEIQKAVYAHLQKLSRAFYSDRRTGELITRVTRDVDQVEELISHALPDTASNIVLAVGVTIAMFYINVPLAAVTMATILPVLTVGLFQKRVQESFRKANDTYEMQNATLTENIQGMREIQLFGRQRDEHSRLEKIFYEVALLWYRAIRWYSYLSPGIEFFTSIGQVVIIAAGGWMIANGRLTSGDVVAFLLYIGLFYGPVAALSNTLESIQKAAAGAARVFEVLDEPVTITGGGIDAGTLCGEIVFDRVSFSYEDGGVILDQLSLTVPKGQIIALTGATGAGKTTLLNLIIRLFDPKQGGILIDGTDIRDYTLDSLRANIAIVSQDVFLFSGTVYDNIAYSKPDASAEEVYSAAKSASIHEFALSLGNGYNTVIGERGVKLSGGQRQRIAIARAILRDTPILLLDEATSAVDEETERSIRAAVMDISGGKTVLIVTHRLASITDADRVITIEDGKIVSDAVK